MRQMIKKNYPYLIVYFAIFLFLFLQHNVIGMYYDDFGNASLSYNTTIEHVVGSQFTISQLFENAIHTYFHFGGRVLYGMIDSLLLKDGIKPFMILQVFVIIGIFYFISDIIASIRKKNSYWYPILCMILYLLFDISILRHGIYWASASILYVWPLLPLFATIAYSIRINYQLSKNKKVHYWKYILIITPLIFLSVFSQEQIGVALIVFFLIYFFFDHFKKEKKYFKYDIFAIMMSVCTYLFLLLAPGNHERLNQYSYFTNRSFIGKIRFNIPNILELLFTQKVYLFIHLFIILLLIYLGYTVISQYRKKRNTLFLLIPFFGMCLDFIFYQKPHPVGSFYIILEILILCSMFTTLVYYYYQKKQLKLLSIPLAAFCSVACLVLSPYLLERCAIPCIFLLFISMISIGFDLFQFNKNCKSLSIILLIVCTCFGIYNASTIYIGYSKNYPIVMSNYHKLEQYQKYTKDNTLHLCRLKDDRYASNQPYDKDYDYWLQQYFDLPEDLIMKWDSCKK